MIRRTQLASLIRFAYYFSLHIQAVSIHIMSIRKVITALSTFFLAHVAAADSPAMSDRSRDNLMVVVRESIGMNRVEDRLSPTGKMKAKLPDGHEIEIELASWEFIGDTHVRFVFDGPTSMANATPNDLEQLGLSDVESAMAVALKNIKRTYGEPTASLWQDGVYSVEGKSADLNSSYFLDRTYWLGLQKEYPEGIIVGLPKRGALLFAPLTNTRGVEELRKSIGTLHSTSGRLRVSSALFLFKDGTWSVFQAPVTH
jgi:hypothetical protein